MRIASCSSSVLSRVAPKGTTTLVFFTTRCCCASRTLVTSRSRSAFSASKRPRSSMLSTEPESRLCRAPAVAAPGADPLSTFVAAWGEVCVLRTSTRRSCTLVVRSSRTRCCCWRREVMSVRVALLASGDWAGGGRPQSSFVVLLPRARWYRCRVLGHWLTPDSWAAEARRRENSLEETLLVVSELPAKTSSSRGSCSPFA